MTKEDYKNLTQYLDFALEYLDRGNIPSAKTEIKSTIQLLEDIRTKKPRTRIALGREYREAHGIVKFGEGEPHGD